jgi:Domain of unknown function (DUF4326)
MPSRRQSARRRAAALVPTARWAAPQPTRLDPQVVRLASATAADTHTAWVAPPSHWAGAACHVTHHTQRAAALADYAVRLAGRPDLITRARGELAGKDLACSCAPGVPCHRDILLDVAQPPADAASGGHGVAITLARPWASLVLLPEALAPTVVHTRSWCTDFRGALCVTGGRRLDERAVAAAAAAGFDARWHLRQSGWLGVGVLVDVHRATPACCRHRGGLHPQHRTGGYHWVWAQGARLARPVPGHGFLGLHPVAWSVLIRSDAG